MVSLKHNFGKAWSNIDILLKQRDGEVDLDEWEVARQQAAEEVNRNHFNLRQQDGVHLMRKPTHGRPYLIANRKVEALTRHYRM